MFLDYLKFIALIDPRMYDYGGINPSAFFGFLMPQWGPSVLLGLHLFMPSQKCSDRCAVITGILCALGMAAAFAIPIWGRDWRYAFAGYAVGMIAVVCAISAAIGFKLRKKLSGKAHRKGISASVILAHFALISVYWFSRQYWV